MKYKFFSDYWHHLKWHILILPVFGLLTYLANYVTDHKTPLEVFWLLVEYFKVHPVRISIPFLVVLVLHSGYLLYKFTQIKWLRLAALERMVKDVGIRSFSHHENGQSKNDWENCKNELKKSARSQLNIMGAAGFETFSSPAAPLHDFLKNTEFEIRILLIDPKSVAFSQRCANTGTSEETYRDWIYTSIEYCRTLKRSRNSPIEVRLYSDYPIWKMIFSPEYMWLQWYQPNTDVENTQVYNFQSTSGPVKSSLFYPLTSVFQRRWALGEQIDLDKWVRPNGN